ncbi:MAG: hypothetical protein AAGB12_03630 [Pseudomonadota bacterium]
MTHVFKIRWLLLSISVCYSSLVFARFYPPPLQPIPIIGKNSQAIGDYAFLAFDDREQLCIVEKNQGFYCYDGLQIQQIADDVIGLVSIDEGEKRQLFFAIDDEIYTFKQGEIHLSHLQINLVANERIMDLYRIDSNSFFISTNKNLYKHTGLAIEKVITLPSGLFIYDIFEVNDEKIEIATSNGVLTFNLHSDESDYRLIGKKIYHIYKDYTLTTEGVYKQSKKISNDVFYSVNASTPQQILLSGVKGICYLKDESVICNRKNLSGKVYESLTDKFGNVWASTAKGIMVSSFSHVEYINAATGLLSDDVYSLAYQEKDVYIGTSLGVNTLNTIDGTISAISETFNHKITALKFIDDFTLWIGTDRGLYRYDLQTKQLILTSLKKHNVTWIEQYQDLIVVATRLEGIFVFNNSGYLLKDNIEKHTSKITTLYHCDDYLFVSSKYNGIRRLNDQFQATHYTDKRNYGIFTCNNEELVTVSDKRKLRYLDVELNDVSIHLIDDDINTMVFHDESLWILHKNRITQWINQKKQGSYAASLKTLYHNLSINLGDWIFASSPDGMAIIDLEAMQKWKGSTENVMLTTTTDSSSGALTIKARFNNLLAVFQEQTLLYRTSNNDTFTILESGQTLLLPYGIPKGDIIEFKGLSSTGVVTPSTFFQDETSSSSNILRSINTWLYFILILGFVILWLQIKVIRRLFVERTTITNDEVNELSPEKFNYALYAERLEQALAASEDESQRFLKRCNTLVAKNGRVYRAKHLANQLNVDTKKIERTLRKFFGSGSVINYQEFYIIYCRKQKKQTHYQHLGHQTVDF